MVLRRMGLVRRATLKSYLDLLRESDEERICLSQDFLVGVTRFFRDPDGYEALRVNVLPALLDRQQDHLRIWVPGCSTGEEVYSLAFMMQIMIEERRSSKTFQIFGTDVDMEALRTAREGIYTREALAEVGEDDVVRFFHETQDRFQVRLAIRENCLFAPHNLLHDPPFSRIDMISCKNLLIYLNEEAQTAIIPRFHYALNPESFLALGPSESTSYGEDMFRPVDRRHRIYKRNDASITRFSALRTNPAPYRGQTPSKHFMPDSFGSNAHSTSLEGLIERQYVQVAAKPFFAIDNADEICYLSSGMSRYVETARGVIQRSVERMLNSGLHLPVRNAVSEARQSTEQFVVKDVVLREGDKSSLFDLVATPCSNPVGTVIVELQQVRIHEATKAEGEAGNLLKREIELAERRRQSLEENYRSSEQQLRSANEELLSMNEELQSSNEELDTSREELQSINEELETINAELTTTNSDLNQSISDMRNLLESTDLAVLFLDKGSKVRLFTPPTEQIFSVLERDIGRPIADLTHNLEYPELLEDVRTVVKGIKPLAREVQQQAGGGIFEVRIRPYLTVSGVIDGSVITFVDVTESRRAEARARAQAQTIETQFSELTSIYDGAPIGLALLDRDLTWLRVNEKISDINGLSAEEQIGKRMGDVAPKICQAVKPYFDEVFETGKPKLNVEVMTPIDAKDGEIGYFIADYYPVFAGDEVYGVGSCVRDVTEEKRLQSKLEQTLLALQESEARLKRMFDAVPAIISMTEGPEHIYAYTSHGHKEVYGDRNPIGRKIADVLPELIGQGIFERLDEVFRSGQGIGPVTVEASLFSGPNQTGKQVPGWYSHVVQPWFKADGSTGGVMSCAFDITDIREAGNQKELMMRELQHRVKNLLTTVQSIAYFTETSTTTKEEFNEAFFERLAAIGHANDHLVSIDTTPRSLSDLIDRECDRLGPALAARIQRDVIDLALPVVQVPVLALAIHELTTNALKYGALKRANGEINIDCVKDDDDWVTFRWTERFGPLKGKAQDVDAPGFGTELLVDLMEQTLRGEASLKIKKTGIVYQVRFPIAPGTS